MLQFRFLCCVACEGVFWGGMVAPLQSRAPGASQRLWLNDGLLPSLASLGSCGIAGLLCFALARICSVVMCSVSCFLLRVSGCVGSRLRGWLHGVLCRWAGFRMALCAFLVFCCCDNVLRFALQHNYVERCSQCELHTHNRKVRITSQAPGLHSNRTHALHTCNTPIPYTIVFSRTWAS